jgi:arylsulfatase A-like enzyme
MGQPNILWICTDQQRYDTLGCMGNEFVRTSHLDGLAERGALFTHAFSQSPVCTPSRAAFLTGRYPRTCRTRQNGADIPEDEILVTRLLAEAGYVCGLSGKLHLSACNPSVCETVERRIDDGYAAFHWSHHSGPGWGKHNEYWAWLADKDREYETPPHPECRYIRLGMPADVHQTTWCAEKACQFVRARAEDGQPWLFSVNVFDPHHAFDPPEAHLVRYLDRLDEIPLPNYRKDELEDKPAYQAYDHDGAYGHAAGFPYDEMTPRDHRMVRAAYWAMCDLIDEQVGRMLAVLEETGQAENTIVIFTSDHGEMLGDHGIYLKGPFFYEPAIRVPLIVALPGHIRPQRSPALIELTDLPQTLLDAVGLPHHPGMQGRSLWPLLSGKADGDHHREDVYCEYYNAMPWHTDPTAQMTMLRTERFKLTVDHPASHGELYDLERDPQERDNLWDDADYTGVKVEMLVRLCNRMAWTVDPLPLRRAAW